jgi:hypothetical protein
MGIAYAEPGHIPYPEDLDTAMDGPAQLGGIALRLAALREGLTTAQRDALSGTDLWAGRRIWNTTTQRTEEYTGSAWRAVGSIDLAAHEAEANPHNGYVHKSTLTAKGDLYVAGASGVITRLPAPANGRAWVADSAETLGWKAVDLLEKAGGTMTGDLTLRDGAVFDANGLTRVTLRSNFLRNFWDSSDTPGGTYDFGAYTTWGRGAPGAVTITPSWPTMTTAQTLEVIVVVRNDWGAGVNPFNVTINGVNARNGNNPLNISGGQFAVMRIWRQNVKGAWYVFLDSKVYAP